MLSAVKKGVFCLLVAFCALAFCALSEGGYQISVSPSGTVRLSPGESQTLTVSVQPRNLMEHEVYWTSQNEYIATVSPKGKVTAVAAGTTTVTATIENGTSRRVTVVVLGNAVETLTIVNPDMELEVGASERLIYEINDDADDKRVRWTTDDASVATVNASGEVTAVSPGTAVITLLAVNGLTATATVYVPADVQSIMIDPGAVSIAPGGECALDAYVFPGNARDREVFWETDDASVATVDRNGVVTAHKKGSCTLRASTANGVSARVPVRVEIVPTNIEISRTVAVLSRTSGAALLEARVLPADADGGIRWVSSDESVAIVRNGLVCAAGYGRARVTAYASDSLFASCEVYVCETPEAVSFPENTYSMSVSDEPMPLSPCFAPENTYGIITGWKSSNPSVVSVDENGVLTPKKYGSARVTVTCLGGLTASADVFVYENASSIYFETERLALTAYTRAEAKIVSQTGNEVKSGLEWSSSDPSVCAFAGGVLYARNPGCATVAATAQDGALRAECEVTVLPNDAVSPKVIALTFDNGPDAYTQEILGVLDSFGARATFFLLGANVERAPKIAACLRDTPHEIGNHTYKNMSLNTMSIADIATSLERTDALIQKAVGRAATVLRAPDANLSARLFTTFLDTRRFVGWSLDTGDSIGNASAEEIARRAFDARFDNAILVFHDSGSETPEALRLLLPSLIEDGYDFVTVSELIDRTGDASAVFTTKKSAN